MTLQQLDDFFWATGEAERWLRTEPLAEYVIKIFQREPYISVVLHNGDEVVLYPT